MGSGRGLVAMYWPGVPMAGNRPELMMSRRALSTQSTQQPRPGWGTYRRVGTWKP